MIAKGFQLLLNKEADRALSHCIVLVGSKNRFEHDFTIKLK